MAIIKDGTGNGYEAKVNSSKELHVKALIVSEAEGATDVGDSYNINTGDISLSTATESALLYVKNNEDKILVVTAIAIGTGSGIVTNPTLITAIRNPTAGTIVSTALAVDMNANRNFSSGRTLTADVYKGAEGNTFTDGTDIAQFYLNANGRLYASIDFELTKGDSIGIKMDPNIDLSVVGGPMNAYAALICHLKEIE